MLRNKTTHYLKRATFLLASLSVTPALSFEDPRACCHGDGPPRWYGSLSGSAVFLQDTVINHTDPAFGGPEGQTFNTGYGISGAIGYQLFSGVRTELEIANRSNTLDKDPGATNSLPPGTSAQQSSVAIMANTYIDLHNSSNYTPYVGAGIGRAHVKNPRYYTNPGLGLTTGKIAGWTTAYQFMTGVSYEITNNFAPIYFNFGYRYFTGQDLDVKLNNAPGKFSVNNDSHNVELGLRIYFK